MQQRPAFEAQLPQEGFASHVSFLSFALQCSVHVFKLNSESNLTVPRLAMAFGTFMSLLHFYSHVLVA